MGHFPFELLHFSRNSPPLDRSIQARQSVDYIFLVIGGISSMKREKEVVQTATIDEEVGITLKEDAKDVRFEPNDTILSYKIIKQSQEINWHPPGF